MKFHAYAFQVRHSAGVKRHLLVVFAKRKISHLKTRNQKNWALKTPHMKNLVEVCTYSAFQKKIHFSSKEKRCFLYFNHLSKEFLEQMIPHLKALI